MAALVKKGRYRYSQ